MVNLGPNRGVPVQLAFDVGQHLFARLCVLSYGVGQESSALLMMYRYSAEFRERYVPDGRLLVIFCDTQDEHEETYAYLAEAKRFCAEGRIPFLHITGDQGYHTGHWGEGFVGQYRATNTVGSVAFPKSCSEQLKIAPFYKALEAWVAREYGLGAPKNKQAFYRYARLYGPLRVLIGFAAGEEKRVSRATTPDASLRQRRRTATARRKTPPARWMLRCIERVYPLIELGMTRVACQEYIRAVGHTIPLPSLCRHRPFTTLRELLWRWHADRPSVEEWFELERAKLEANRHMGDKNYAVFKTMTLPVALEVAYRRYGHLSFAELDALRMREGHCVGTRF